MVIGTLLTALALLLFAGFENRKSVPEKGFLIRFGIIRGDEAGEHEVVKETTTIPLLTQETGFCFGYSIEPPDNRVYSTHEVIHLPAPPIHIDFQMPVEKFEGGRIIRTPSLLRRDQMIYPFCFSPGDPLGLWKLEIFIDGEIARVVRFDVVRP